MKPGFKIASLTLVISTSIVLIIVAMNFQVSQTDVRNPERYIAYVADADDGPRLSLNKNESVLRFLTYFHIPRQISRETYVPDEPYVYDLVFSIYEADQLLDERRVRVKTKKTKRWDNITGQISQSSFYPIGTNVGEPADARVVDLDFGEFAGPGRTLRVTAESEDGSSVSVIVFREMKRLELSIERKLPKQRASPTLARRVGVTADVLSDDEVSAANVYGWRRKTTLVESKTRVLFDVALPKTSKEIPLFGQEIEPGLATTFYLKGPATISLIGLGAERAHNVSVETMTIDVETSTITSTDTETQLTVVTPSRAQRAAVRQSVARTFEIPDGVLQSIIIRSEASVRLVAWTDSLDSIIGETPYRPIGTNQWEINPDIKKIRYWSVEPSVRFTIGTESVTSDAARISLVRAQPEPVMVKYRFVGTTVEGELLSDAPISEFDQIAFGQGEIRRVSHPSSFKIPIPKGATRLELESTSPRVWGGVSLLEFQTTTPSIRGPAYDGLSENVTWRHAPFISYPWNRILPDDVREREKLGRYASMYGQVRLERKEEEGYDFTRESPVASAARYRRLPLREQVSLWERSVSGDKYWVNSNEEFQCRATRDFKIRIFTPEQSLGKAYSVFWNGDLLRRNVLRTESTTSKVFESGAGKLRVDAPPGARVFVDCLPDSFRSAWKARSVAPWSQTVNVSVPHGRSTTWLNAVVYGFEQNLNVSSVIDGGKPPASSRTSTVLFPADRETQVVVDRNDAFLTREPFRMLPRSGRFSIPIGSNWAEGKRRVELNRGQGTQLFVRFFLRDDLAETQ